MRIAPVLLFAFAALGFVTAASAMDLVEALPLSERVIMVHVDEPSATSYRRARHASPSSSAFFRATPQR